jgi:putative PIG3 family NAD(P)H quinone oxidoreductase
MNLIDLDGHGGPEVLVPRTGPVPSPGADEVLVRVRVAGVNRPDCLQRSGGYPPPPGASPIPGLEIAGDVVAVGPGTPRWRVGDRVCALVAGGGYAEYCVAPGPQCLPVPAGLDWVRAAALPETYFTVWTNLIQRGRLAAGETCLIHGGSSGIGTTAIMIAKHRGARVLTTAGSPAKLAACAALGADVGIDYRREDYEAVVARETGGRGVDLILDMVGGDYVPRNLRSLALEGRLVQIAFLSGSKVAFDMTPVMVKRLTVTGSTLRPRTVAQKAAIAVELERDIWPELAAGRMLPVIHATFPLAQAADAHRLMESSAHIGKIMLTVAA